MQQQVPIVRNPHGTNWGRNWLPPTGLLALILAVSYLPAHGVVGLRDIATGTIAALGLVGASVATARWVRNTVTSGSGSVALVVPGLSAPEFAPPPAAGRRIAGVALGAAVSSAATVATIILLGIVDSSTAGHAVLVVALYANVALLLSNVTPMPPWAGWTLLLAILDRRNPAAAIVRSAGLVDRYLTTRRLGAVARPLTTTAGADEPALLAGERRPSARAVIAVMDGDAFLGAVGPRQVAAVSTTAPRTSCGDAMIPADQLELLRVDAPATAALPQLHRHGFAIVTGPSPLRYVEVDDLLQRMLMTACVARAVRDRPRFGSPATDIDPVCGMAVNPAAASSLQWNGRDYHFCEVACRERFQEDPELWVAPMANSSPTAPSCPRSETSE